jgi:hypothetical protein
VVVVEAKGSLSPKKAEIAPIKRLARNAYKRQVHDFIGTESEGLVVASGYAIAFGAVPGTQTSKIAIASPQMILVGPRPVRQPVPLSAAASSSGMAGQFVQLMQEQKEKTGEEELEEEQKEGQQHPPQQPQVEQRHTTIQVQTPYVRSGSGRGGGGGDDGGERRREGERAQPSGRIAFANYENVFLLCGATNAAAFLRRILSGRPEEPVDSDSLIQEFWWIELPELVLLGSAPFMRPFQFGIYSPSARVILESAANNRLSPPATVELAIAPVETVRDLPGGEDQPVREIVMQGDGLALFRWPPHQTWHYRTWDLGKGGWV